MSFFRTGTPKHMEKSAFEIVVANHDPLAFEAAAREEGFLGFGFYPAQASSMSTSVPGVALGGISVTIYVRLDDWKPGRQ